MTTKRVGPERRVFDWTPDLGDRQAWLDDLRAQGWVPDYPTGTETVVNGRTLIRYAARKDKE